MKSKKIEELLSELMQVCGFGEITQPIRSVSGGFMHRMYQVATDQGTYAVKHLNAEIMSRPETLDNLGRAESIEKILESRNLPIVPALTVRGSKMQQIEGHYFYIFDWQAGQITDWNHITYDQCKMAGSILGKIHAIDPKTVLHKDNNELHKDNNFLHKEPMSISYKEPELSHIDWHSYTLKAKEINSRIADCLTKNEELFIYAEREMNQARKCLPDLVCLSDEDMDPKNIMWHNGEPKVIDLECLDYGNPVSHVLQLALQWSGITTCDLDVERIVSFFDGYLASYENGFRSYSNVFGIAYTWVEWLEFNIKRALDAYFDEDERAMGISQVKSTIDRIKYLKEKEIIIKTTLDTRLPVCF